MQDNQKNPVPWAKILVVSVLNLIILTFIYWNVLVVQENMIKQAETAYMQDEIHTLESMLTEIKQEIESINYAITFDPLVEEWLKRARYQEIKELYLPGYFKLQKKYALSNLEFISDEGVVMWSVNNPVEKGEEVSYKRFVQASLQSKKSLTVIDSGDTKLNMVSTIPLFIQDKYTGISELSIPLNKALARKLSLTEQGHYAIFQLDGIQRNLIWEDKKLQVVLNTSDLKKIHQGEAFFRPTQDKKAMLVVLPLKDIDGISSGYIQAEISRQMFGEARTNNRLFLLIITLLILFASFLIVNREGLNFSSTQPEMVNLTDSGKISRVSIHIQPVLKDHTENESPEKIDLN